LTGSQQNRDARGVGAAQEPGALSELRSVCTVAAKDLRLEFRSGGRLAAMAAFVVLAGFLFGVSLDRSVVPGRASIAALLWLVALFVATGGAGQAFAADDRDGAFRHVLLAPVSRHAVFLGKTIANLVLLWLVTILAFASLTAFLGVRSPGPLLWHAAVLLPGTIGLAAAGTFFGRMATQSTLGEALLPVLIFPLLVPVVFFGATATARVFLERPWPEISGPVRLLWTFAAGSVAVGATLFRHLADD